MKKKVAELLYEHLDNVTCGEARLRDDYSGRGMYGETTYAISGDFDHADVAEAVAEIYDSGDADAFDLKPAHFRYVTDDMGLGIVIY